MTKRRRLTLIAVALSSVVLGSFAAADLTDDSTAHRYERWKRGRGTLTRDEAMYQMLTDPERDALVVGKTRRELAERFGPLRELAEASPYERDYCFDLHFRPADVAFLAENMWMVVFEHGRATNLVLLKGC
jgi:hypothetical protein